MRKKILSVLLLCSILLGTLLPATAKSAPHEVQISNSATHTPIADHLFGFSFEGATTALETGLYANMVYNSSFEEVQGSASLPGWELFGAYTIEDVDGMSENNRRFLTLPEGKTQKIKNLGFCEENMQTQSKQNKDSTKTNCRASMGIEAGENYIFTAWFKNTNTIVTVSLENEKGEKLSDTNTFIVTAGSEWTKFSFPLSAAKNDYGYLLIEFAGGPVSVDAVSLIPEKSYGLNQDTWKYVALRKDMFNALKNAHPGFLRFPVVCSAHHQKGVTFTWESTIGPLEERRPASSLPTTEAKQYNSSRAIGLHEMLQLCEDIGAMPIPLINVDSLIRKHPVSETMTMETTTAEKSKHAEDVETTTAVQEEEPPETPEQKAERMREYLYLSGTKEWENYLLDVLNMLSYAKDTPTSPWGTKRAENGHSEAYPLYYLSLDTESEKDEVYFYLANLLKDAIQKVYPSVQIIISTDYAYDKTLDEDWNEKYENYVAEKGQNGYFSMDGASDSKKLYDFAQTIRQAKPGNLKWCLDSYNLQTKTYSKRVQKSYNLEKALNEAVLMLSAEQNSALISMVAYAPTFARMDIPDAKGGLLLFNAHATLLTPSYYVQQLFMNHMGTELLDAALPEKLEGVYQSVSVDPEKEVLYIKLVNTTDSQQNFKYSIDGFENIRYADVLSVSGSRKSAHNSIGDTKISIQQNRLKTENGISLNVGENSVNVLRIAYGNNQADENLYKLEKLPEPTRRYTTEQKMLTSSVFAAVILICVLIYALWLYRKWKHKKEQ